MPKSNIPIGHAGLFDYGILISLYQKRETKTNKKNVLLDVHKPKSDTCALVLEALALFNHRNTVWLIWFTMLLKNNIINITLVV